MFVTSHQAHFVEQRPVPAAYAPVAVSKRACESAVREWATEHGIDLAVVSGDMIEGTITVKLLERIEPGTMAGRLDQVGRIPTVAEFATEITAAALGPLPAATVYGGGGDYSIPPAVS
ncbi:MAG: Enoyl-[acyl-carrier-protein] reductase [NADPH] [uncultured Propionibacteriaceae bacterium]|uniref:Enoyl-[acyl-carrier-protein] reductase [NADPH] n=1 Tax=uncultured Propionibacteriaceae bacterium TaxID=257457 RepID=A0A6J4NXF9_9ACTN|nr:MAG: Enoyl-[acyl-carrier-protein] reductase [NADPH] [uncultured Propionibacteriaceae bacterium]